MKWLKPIRARLLSRQAACGGRRRSGKKGSYIVEAAIVLPVFIAAVIALMSVVPVIASCENMTFAAADEMRLEAVKSAFRKSPAALPLAVEERIRSENPKTDTFRTVFYRYLYKEKDIESLFSLHFRASFSQNSPAGIFDSIVFDGKVTGRAFTGKLHKEVPSAGSDLPEDDKIVYIFPEWGMRYHGKSCTYVKAACRMVYLSQDTKKAYQPCSLCNARSAQIGSPVFCFTQSGRAYHLSSCRVVQRYYVEIKRKEAVEKGYTPCSKCGGG